MGSAPPQPTLTSRIQLGAYGPVTCSLRRPSHRGAHSILTTPTPTHHHTHTTAREYPGAKPSRKAVLSEFLLPSPQRAC